MNIGNWSWSSNTLAGHLLQKANSLEKTGKDWGQEKGTRWLDSITDSMDMSLSRLREVVEDRGAWLDAVHGIAKSQTQFSHRTTTAQVFYTHICFLGLPQQSAANCGSGQHKYIVFLETDSLKSKWWHSHATSAGLGKSLPQTSPWTSSTSFACGRITPVFTGHPPCVQTYVQISPLKGPQSCGIGGPPYSSLTSSSLSTSAKTLIPNQITFWGLGD